MSGVPLVEQSGAGSAMAGRPRMTTMADGVADSGTSVNFQPGGRRSNPVVMVGNLELGYEDILLIVAVADLLAMSIRLVLEVTE